MSNKRFLQYQASLRSYLRSRGAQIDARNKTITIDREFLTTKEEKRLNELLKWGYTLANTPPESPHLSSGDDSFIAFADEIMELYNM